MKNIIFALMCCSLIACSDDDSTSTNQGVAGTILNVANSAVESVGEALPDGSGFKSGQAGTLASDCDESVSDLSSDAAGAGQFLACLLKTNSKNPETPIGSFHLVTKIMELLERDVDFVYAEGFTSHENVSGTIDTSDGNQAVVLSLKERAVSSVWDYHIQLCILSVDAAPLNSSLSDCESGGFTFELYLVNNGTEIGFKTIERFGGFAGGTAFFLNVLTQELRYEGWDESNGRHSRVYVQGVISADYKLGTVTSAAIAFAGQGVETSGDGTDGLYAEYDGANLCINTWDDNDNNHANGPGNGIADLTVQGVCSVFPSYSGGFFISGGLESFLTDDTKGILNFTAASFGSGSYFINN